MTKDQENSGVAEKSKSQLRAERREKQEAQRAAKANKKQPNDVVKPSGAQEKSQKAAKPPAQKLTTTNAPANPAASSVGSANSSNQVEKPSGRKPTEPQSSGVASVKPYVSSVEDSNASAGDSKQQPQNQSHSFDISSAISAHKQLPAIHPSFHRLGLKISSESLLGSDAQCIAMIEAFKMLINEYHPPVDKIFSREIENAMKPCVSFVSAGRPLSPALASLVKQLKVQLTHLASTNSEEEARKILIDWLDDFLEHKIILSTQAICLTVAEKLRSFKETPIILTYSYSSIIEEIFLCAHKNGVRFEVVVVDSLPQKQGQILLRRLIELGVNCRYVLISGLTHVANDVNLVLLGADGLLANGSVVCTFGGSQVAMVAKYKNIPVLIACQTYKFCEKVQTGTLEAGWPGNEVMPSEFVTGVVTELRMLPCSAVPAVLRVKQLT